MLFSYISGYSKSTQFLFTGHDARKVLDPCPDRGRSPDIGGLIDQACLTNRSG